MFIVRFLLVFFLAVEDVLMTPPSKSVPSNTSTPDSSEGEMDRFSSRSHGSFIYYKCYLENPKAPFSDIRK
jgi:hypothetical protein